MTVKELSQLYWLNREIELDCERLKELEQKAISVSASSVSGTPVGNYISSKIERYTADIVDLREIIQTKQQQCIYERNRLESYISTIPDSLTRQIFTLRYVNGLPWSQVASHIGGGNTADSVKKVCYRYINRTRS